MRKKYNRQINTRSVKGCTGSRIRGRERAGDTGALSIRWSRKFSEAHPEGREVVSYLEKNILEEEQKAPRPEGGSVPCIFEEHQRNWLR